MSTQQQPTLRGIRLTDNGDGTYTLTHSGDGSVDAATAAVHSALVTTFPEVGVLVRDVVEGRRGKAAPFEDAPYRPRHRAVRALPTGDAHRAPCADWST